MASSFRWRTFATLFALILANSQAQQPTCASLKQDFETGWGLFSQSQSDDFDWTRDSRGTPSSNTGPSRDYDPGTAAGWYVYIKTSFPRSNGDVARIDSNSFPPLMPSKTCTIQFGYHMYGATTRTLNVSVTDVVTKKEYILFSETGNKRNQWNCGSISFDRTQITGNWTVSFTGVRGTSWSGDIAIDGIEPSPGCGCAGPSYPCIETSTDFDSGWGMFSNNDTVDDFDWSLRRGTTPSFSTGPSRDHTTGSGQYAYIETSFPRANGDEAHLFSKWIQGSGNDCSCTMSFWYHMYGASTRTLRVEIEEMGKQNRAVAWSMTGNKGNQWLSGSVCLNATSLYRIVFVGVRGTSFTGDIAIDDIQLNNCNCPKPLPQPIPVMPTNCTFGVGSTGTFCDWKQPISPDVFWVTKHGQSVTPDTGPDGRLARGVVYYALCKSQTSYISDEKGHDNATKRQRRHARTGCMSKEWKRGGAGKNVFFVVSHRRKHMVVGA
ncbi:MAM and LDL-receptor class A domain-containing protein 1-like isoform X2 [Oscarella lobularis]|uniref:MAM and LDL-receptor class A domain-containing protein 1-like isoform X2 n=1 Tax=Oscarella lobularis TaxID=121494 RepID=UPI0033144031